MSRYIDDAETTGPVFGRKRAAVVERCQDLQRELAELDQQLLELSRRRQQAARDLRAHRSRLWPRLNKRGRRPQPDGRRALPPIAADAPGLWGVRLRSHCRDLLREARRACTLVELHALLHRQGYFVGCAYPVKELADAMRYEVLAGRLVRIARGTYRLA